MPTTVPTTQVVKRDGRRESVRFDKISKRIEALRDMTPVLAVDVTRVVAGVCASVRDGITTSEIDELTACTAAAMSTTHPDYGILGARILVSNLQKSTSDSVQVTFRKMADVLDPEFLACVRRNAKDFQAMVRYDRDFDFDFFGVRTMERMYLTRVDGTIVERPQHMWLRVAIALWKDDLERVKETYDLLSTKKFTHASPTLFNAGMKTQQLASCESASLLSFPLFLRSLRRLLPHPHPAGFLTGIEEDSLAGIYKCITDVAMISKFGGGLGVHISDVRGKGAPIKGTNGTSDGVVPMLRVLDATGLYVNQVSTTCGRGADPHVLVEMLTKMFARSQGGKRKGAIAVYFPAHHPDILEILAMKRNSGDEHMRARNLFYALFLNSLFMKRVEADAQWSLFDPSTAPGLSDVYGKEFEDLYEKYEAEGRAVRTLPAQTVWFEILRSQVETGTPYIIHGDHANEKSAQKNLGTLKTSNLCAEILQWTSKDEVSTCTLASVNLSAFVRDGEFDFDDFMATVRVASRNLDKVIDINAYPIPEAERSSKRHRPVGLGAQGLQDVFHALKLPFDSSEAADLNKRIFAAMYHAALSESCALAEKLGAYESFAGSPADGGILQFDMVSRRFVGLQGGWAGLQGFGRLGEKKQLATLTRGNCVRSPGITARLSIQCSGYLCPCGGAVRPTRVCFP